MEDELVAQKTIIRSILIASSDDMPVKQFFNEYKEFVGGALPFEKFGCRSALEFLDKISDTVLVFLNYQGEQMIRAKVNESTRHIDTLVKTQKKPSKHPVRRAIRPVLPITRKKGFGKHFPQNSQQKASAGAWSSYNFRDTSAELTAPCYEERSSLQRYMSTAIGSKTKSRFTSAASKRAVVEPTSPAPACTTLRESKTVVHTSCQTDVEGWSGTAKTSVPNLKHVEADSGASLHPCVPQDGKPADKRSSKDVVACPSTAHQSSVWGGGQIMWSWSTCSPQNIVEHWRDKGNSVGEASPQVQGTSNTERLPHSLSSSPLYAVQTPSHGQIRGQFLNMLRDQPFTQSIPRSSVVPVRPILTTVPVFSVVQSACTSPPSVPSLHSWLGTPTRASPPGNLNPDAAEYVPKTVQQASPQSMELCPLKAEMKDEETNTTDLSHGLPADMVLDFAMLLHKNPDGLEVEKLVGLYKEEIGQHVYFEQSRGPLEIAQDIIASISSISVSSFPGNKIMVKSILQNALGENGALDKFTEMPKEIYQGIMLALSGYEDGVDAKELLDLMKHQFAEHQYIERHHQDVLGFVSELLAHIPSVIVTSRGSGLYNVKLSTMEHCIDETVQTTASLYSSIDESDTSDEPWSLLTQELPKAQSFEVAIGEVFSPSKFYILVHGKKTTGKLEQLMKNLNAFYSKATFQHYKVALKDIVNGYLCAAPCILDGKPVWHRAVVECIKASKVYVLYIDYGTVSPVKKDDLRRLRSDFMELPAQGVKVSLARVAPKDSDSWTMEANTKFLHLTRMSALHTCSVVEQQGDTVVVELNRVIDGVAHSLSDILVNEGFAESTCAGSSFARNACTLRPENEKADIKRKLITKLQSLEEQQRSLKMSIYDGSYQGSSSQLNFLEVRIHSVRQLLKELDSAPQSPQHLSSTESESSIPSGSKQSARSSGDHSDRDSGNSSPHNPPINALQSKLRELIFSKKGV